MKPSKALPQNQKRLSTHRARPLTVSSACSSSTPLEESFLDDDFSKTGRNLTVAHLVPIHKLSLGIRTAGSPSQNLKTFKAQARLLLKHEFEKLRQASESALILTDLQASSMHWVLRIVRPLLDQNVFITKLVLCSSAGVLLDDEELASLESLIRTNHTLKCLDLSECVLPPQTSSVLARALGYNWRLEDLILQPLGAKDASKSMEINRQIRGNKSVARCRDKSSTVLNGSNRAIATVPQYLFDDLEASMLTKIDFSHNCFRSIPQQIFDILSLKYLIFSNNCLTKIDPKICRLVHLEHLDLSVNPALLALPLTLNLISTLKQISVFQTQIQMVHLSIAHLPNLTQFDLLGTPCIAAVEEFLASKMPGDLHATDLQKLQFYHTLSNPGAANKSARLLLIGPESGTQQIFHRIEERALLLNRTSKSSVAPPVVRRNQDALTLTRVRDTDLNIVTHHVNIENFTSFHLLHFQQMAGTVLILVVDIASKHFMSYTKFWLEQIRLYGCPNIYLVATSTTSSNRSESQVRELLSNLFNVIGSKMKNLSLVTSLGAFEGDAESAQTLYDRLIQDISASPSIAPGHWTSYLAEILQSWHSMGLFVLEEREQMLCFAPYPVATQKILLGFWAQYQQLGKVIFHRTLRVSFLFPKYIDLLISQLRLNPPNHVDGVIKSSVLAPFLIAQASMDPSRFPLVMRIFFQLGLASPIASPDPDDPLYFVPLLLTSSSENATELSVFWPTTIAHNEEYSERVMSFSYLPKGFFDQMLVRIMSFGCWKLRTSWSHGIILDSESTEPSPQGIRPTSSSEEISLVRQKTEALQSLTAETLPGPVGGSDDSSEDFELVALANMAAAADIAEISGGVDAAGASSSSSGSVDAQIDSPMHSLHISGRSRPAALAQLRSLYKVSKVPSKAPEKKTPSPNSSHLGSAEMLPFGSKSDLFSMLATQRRESSDDEIIFQHSSGSFAPQPRGHHRVRLFLEFDEDSFRLFVRIRGVAIAPLLLSLLESLNTLVEDLLHIPSEILFTCPGCKSSPFNSLDLVSASYRSLLHINCPNCQMELSTDLLAPDISLNAINFGVTSIPFEDLSQPQLIATGSEGTKVFQASYKNYPVAVKQIGIPSSSQEAFRSLAEVRREIWILSSLRHPNILRIEGLSRNTKNGRLLIVVEKCDRDLQRHLLDPEADISWESRIELAQHIAAAMSYLHARNPIISHRDLKSPNILVRRRPSTGRVVAKVADFGMARVLGMTTMMVRAAEGDGLDNCLWQAPEIIKKAEIDHTADIYAFGIILWELFTRQIPFGQFTWMSQTADYITSGGRPEMPPEAQAFPEFVNIMKQCWSEKRAQRPPFLQVCQQLAGLRPPVDLIPCKPLPATSAS